MLLWGPCYWLHGPLCRLPYTAMHIITPEMKLPVRRRDCEASCDGGHFPPKKFCSKRQWIPPAPTSKNQVLAHMQAWLVCSHLVANFSMPALRREAESQKNLCAEFDPIQRSVQRYICGCTVALDGSRARQGPNRQTFLPKPPTHTTVARAPKFGPHQTGL